MTKDLFRAEKLTSQEIEKSWRLFLCEPHYTSRLTRGGGYILEKHWREERLKLERSCKSIMDVVWIHAD